MKLLKQEAARQGRTMSELVETALRQFLRPQRGRQRLEPLPTFRSGGALLGAIRAADEAIAREPGVPHGNILVVAAAARARLGDTSGASRTLAEAVRHGFRNPEALASEAAFAPLRALPAWRDLVATQGG